MRVIIMAAGASARFRVAGYQQSKPFIPVLGRPMLGHAIEAVRSVDKCPLVLVRENEDAVYDLGGKPVMVRHPQNGAALTMLCASGWVEDGEAVLALDCDNIYSQDYFRAFLRAVVASTDVMEALTLTTTSTTGENWSFVRGSNGIVEYVAEKHRISDRITCGATAYPSWAVLRTAICKLLSGEKIAATGEYYLAPCMNYTSCAVGYYDIPPQAFRTVGTPAELEAYHKEQQWLK